MFTGLEHVWRTDDHGGSEASLGSRCNPLQLDPNRTCGDWAPIGQNLTSNRFGDRAGQFVVATERAPSDSRTLWAATRTGRVFVTSNADAGALDVSFDRIDTASTPGRFVSGIAIDPNDPDHAWVSYTGYSAYAPGGHVYEVRYTPSSHDATWTDRSYDLGDQPVTGIAFNDQTGDAYASTDFGVMRLPRGSAVWEDAAPGMPKVAVYGLTLPDSAHVLYAATHGRSAYALKLPARPTGSISGPSNLTVGQAATFTASGQTWDGRGVAFAWQLPGTPSTASGPSATFRPNAAGTATVQVTLTDDRGTSGDTSDDLTTTLTKPVTIAPAGTGRPDRTPPRLRLSHVRRVRLPKASTLQGRATDGSGIRSVRVSWGDRRHSTARLRSNGAFTLHHRYRRAKRYQITVVAIDKAGNRTTRHVTAVVRHRARR